MRKWTLIKRNDKWEVAERDDHSPCGKIIIFHGEPKPEEWVFVHEIEEPKEKRKVTLYRAIMRAHQGGEILLGQWTSAKLVAFPDYQTVLGYETREIEVSE